MLPVSGQGCWSLPIGNAGFMLAEIAPLERGDSRMKDYSSIMRWAPPAYILLFMLAMVAFWPGYLAVPKMELSGWVHFHAITGTLWMVMLIVQPLAIRHGKMNLHRLIGKLSPLLMLFVMITFVGLSHASLQGLTASTLGIGAYFFYIRVVLVAIFLMCYVLGFLNRHNPAVHARYMVCTGLSFIDPVMHRISHRLMQNDEFNYQLITFGLVWAILVALIIAERKAASGRKVFPIVLAAFLIGGIPLALDFFTWGWPWDMWKQVTAEFAGLPLT